MVSINVPPPQHWGGQHTEMFVNHVTVFSQSVTRIRLSHTILCNVCNMHCIIHVQHISSISFFVLVISMHPKCQQYLERSLE